MKSDSGSNDLVPFEAALLENIQKLGATQELCVAFSGGLDSKSLLHALVRLRDRGTIKNLTAIHVNHGLQAIADQWLTQCQLDCQQYQVTLLTSKLQLSDQSNVEAAARQGRYQFFESVLEQNQHLVMAHHLDDQAETLLFRLLRGCGLEGAAGMPERRRLAKGFLIRPLLNISRAEIEAYARQNKLRWIEDPTNRSEVYSRNFLRHQILTQLKQKWPSYNKTFARFTQVASEQNQLLEEIAIEDLKACQQQRDLSLVENAIDINQFKTLSLARQKNCLHHWGKLQFKLPPSFTEINEVLRQIKSIKNTAINIRFSSGRVRSYAQCLISATIEEPSPINQPVVWEKIDDPVHMSETVFVVAQKTADIGLRLPLGNEQVILKSRHGGEKCLPDYRNKSTDLKKIYQELNVPPWQRIWLPLVYYNQTLVAVPGVFVDKKYLSQKGEDAINLSILDQTHYTKSK